MPLMVETINPSVRHCVTSLYTANHSSGGEPTPAGTAFFAFIPRRSNPKLNWNLLITARHVIIDERTQKLASPLWMRFNLKTGGSELVRIDEALAADPYSVIVPDDPTLDLAVMLVEPEATSVEVRSVPVDAFVRPRLGYERAVLGEGSDVFYPTLFVSVPGVVQQHPLCQDE
jgi:hypothetical protein